MRFLMLLLFAVAMTVSGAEYPVAKLRVYPLEFQDQYKDLILTKAEKSLTIYGSVVIPPGTGALRVRLAYRNTAGTQLKLGLVYRTAEGGNGSAGRVAYSLPEQLEGGIFETIAEVPTSAVGVQITININGGPGQLELKKLEYDRITDRAAIPQVAVSGKPSGWKKAAELQNFYISSGGGAAKVQTRARLAYDARNLYVGYIAEEPQMEHLKSIITVGDGPLWQDDVLELFLYDPAAERGWQFIVNSANVRFDAMLKQAQAGDPFKSDKSWNGVWQSEVFKNADSWEAALVIPWSTLGFNAPPPRLDMNFARERKGGNENSHWNAFSGNFNDVLKFAEATFDSTAEIRRYREQETQKYIPERAQTRGNELLSSEPGGYIVGAWAHGSYQNDYPEAVRKDFTPERQQAFLKARADAGMFGPLLPWAAMERNIPGGITELRRQHREWGSAFPYAVFSSAIHLDAVRKYNAPIYLEKRTDPASAEYLRATLDVFDKLGAFLKEPDNRGLVALIHGIDEPTNNVYNLYSRSRNAKISAALDRVDTEIKESTGFGKFGLHDAFAKADADTPFRRIAFWRYWNRNFAGYLRATTAKSREVAPGIPYLAINRNTCSGMCELDLAALSPHAEWFSCDPYPTSTRSFFGMARALYHTGFSVRMVHDLANRSRTGVMPQGFIYHGGRPTPDDMREWASQALKNGAELFDWYTSGPAALNMPDGYAAMLTINKQLKNMNKLVVPRTTQSAILFSDYDRWGLDDRAGHAVYTVYALLGEHVKANFRFISPTGLALGDHSLEGINTVYIPRMRFTDPDTTKRLLDFAKNGGTLVVFDPAFWSYNIDGSSVPERSELTGGMAPRGSNAGPLQYGRAMLPVSPVAHLKEEPAGIQAFDFADATGKVLAAYPDGKPAALEKTLGKGRMVIFAVQPFGNSAAALKPEGWTGFFTDFCRQAKEETGLPVWDYVLPDEPIKTR